MFSDLPNTEGPRNSDADHASDEGSSSNPLIWHPPDSRVDLEGELAERGALLSAIAAASDELIFLKDAEGRYRFMSEASARILGRPVSEVLGRTDFELMPATTAAELRARDEGVWQTGLAEERDEVVPRDGEPRLLRTRKSLLRDSRGRPIGVLGLSRDVTEARRAADANALLAAIVGTSDDAIVGKALDGTILTWNASAERLLGWTALEAIGSSIMLVIPPELRDEEAEVIARLAAGEHIHHYQTVRVRKDGRRVEVSLSISPVRDVAGRVVMAAKIFRDVTHERVVAAERERLLAAEHAGRIEAQRMQALLEDQAMELESQAVELEATVDELRTANDELILEREAAERARAESERVTRMLDAVVDQLPVGLYVAEAPSGRLLLHNRKAAELLGHRTMPTDVLADLARDGAEHLDGTPYAPEDRALARAVSRGQTVDQEELRYRRPDGSVIDLSVSAAPVRDAEGRAIMAVCTFLDVTASRSAQRALAERDALLRGFFGAPGVMMMVMEPMGVSAEDPDFRILLANPESSRWLGIPPDEVVGRAGRAVGAPEAAAMRRHAQLFTGVLESGTPVTLELPSAARPGAWLRMSVSPLTGSDGDARGVAVLMFDVTEEHHAEEARRRLQLLVEHATDYIGVASLSLEAEYVNPAGLALIGAPSLDVLLGHSVLDQFDDVARGLIESEVGPTVERRGWWAGETVLRHLGTGAPIPVEMTTFAVTDPATGAPLAYGSVCRPIGERQRLQAELRQAQKMEAVGRLAGGIAHDFNNLLTVVLSYSALLSEALPSHDPMRADVEQIRLAGERAATLTHQLLAFSRQQVLQPRIVNLDDIVAGTEKMLRRLIGEDVELLTVQTPELGHVLVDPGQIEQVIMNLAVNARDAMPAGGKLTIETANVTLDGANAPEHVEVTPGPHVMLAVTDTGVGMDSATQARVFEPFFTTKEPGKGTGLGLSTVFGIVKQSGGSIWVYSEPGKGTAMKIYFPCADPAAAPAPVPAPHERPQKGGAETILLVEDEERVRVVAATILRRYGYHVLDAQSGGDALLICEQHAATIHLLLSDVVMPRMSGPELGERLRRVHPEMKILFMSGYTDRSIINHAVFDSDMAFIQKPLTPELLAQKVREVLDAPRHR